MLICEDYHDEQSIRYHKLLLVTELIFSNNPKAKGKIWCFCQGNLQYDNKQSQKLVSEGNIVAKIAYCALG